MTAALALLALLTLLPLPASAGPFREEIHVEPGGRLEVDLAAGSVVVETHDEPRVEVEAESSGLGGGMHFELSGDGRDARLVGRRGTWLGGLIVGGSARVRLRIPAEFSIELHTGGGSIEIEELRGSVDARTSGGSVDVDDVHGSVELRTSGGSIRVEDVAGDLVARTSGGSIQVDEVSGSVEARTSGGSIRIHEVSGPILARTSGGSISVRFTRAPEGDVETSGGHIEAEFPEATGVDLEARTTGGHVRIDDEVSFVGSIAPREVNGRINGGGALLRLYTSGGNVEVLVR